jgi:UrcA family protein
MTIKLITSAFAALAAIAVLTAAPAASAREPAQGVTVSYGDLNLASPKGVEALFSRIGHASRKVCGERPAHIMNNVLTRYLGCRDAVMSETVRRIGVPAVSLAWADKHDALVQMASR